jgi:hypothetical protein
MAAAAVEVRRPTTASWLCTSELVSFACELPLTLPQNGTMQILGRKGILSI